MQLPYKGTEPEEAALVPAAAAEETALVAGAAIEVFMVLDTLLHFDLEEEATTGAAAAGEEAAGAEETTAAADDEATGASGVEIIAATADGATTTGVDTTGAAEVLTAADEAATELEATTGEELSAGALKVEPIGPYLMLE